MNKTELTAHLQLQTEITNIEAKEIVEEFFGLMADALAQDWRVEIQGLCSFCIKSFKGHSSLNPQSGQRVAIEPKRLPVFKCGKDLKERVNRTVADS